MAKIIQLGGVEAPPIAQRWVLVSVVRGSGGKSNNGLNTTFETPISSLPATLAEAARYADEQGIPAVYVRLPVS